MINLKKTLLLFSLLLDLPACATSTALSHEPIEGVVREEGTNKPIPGAIVIARWQGSSPVFIADSQTVCFHVEITVTDEQGRYRIPPLPEEPRHRRIEDKRVITTAYKSGYRYTGGTKRVDYLQPFTGGREERLKYLERTYGSGCGASDGSERNSIPLLKAQYEEAKAIASTKQDFETVEKLLFGLESLEFGSMKALHRMTERRKIQK